MPAPAAAPAPAPVDEPVEDTGPKLSPEELLALRMGMTPQPMENKYEALLERSAEISHDPKMKTLSSTLSSHTPEAAPTPVAVSKSRCALRTGGTALVERRVKELERGQLQRPQTGDGSQGRFSATMGASSTTATTPLQLRRVESSPASPLSSPTAGDKQGDKAFQLISVPPSDSNTLVVQMPDSGMVVSKDPRDHQYDSSMEFHVEIQDRQMFVRRVDTNSGWNQTLYIKCWFKAGRQKMFSTSYQRTQFRDHTDKTLKRLLVDMDLANPQQQKHYSHQSRCDHLDKMHGWYYKHSYKEKAEAQKEKKTLNPPAYLSFSQEGPVSPGSLRVQFKHPSPLLGTIRRSGSSPALEGV